MSGGKCVRNNTPAYSVSPALPPFLCVENGATFGGGLAPRIHNPVTIEIGHNDRNGYIAGTFFRCQAMISLAVGTTLLFRNKTPGVFVVDFAGITFY